MVMDWCCCQREEALSASLVCPPVSVQGHGQHHQAALLEKRGKGARQSWGLGLAHHCGGWLFTCHLSIEGLRAGKGEWEEGGGRVDQGAFDRGVCNGRVCHICRDDVSLLRRGLTVLSLFPPHNKEAPPIPTLRC